MIFGSLKQLSDYAFLEDAVKECFSYADSHDLISYEKGRHDIDDERLYVNIAEYTTTTAEERFWEAHRCYLDVHVMLRGTEQIDIGFTESMVSKDYVEADDFLPLEGEKNASVILKAGDFLICGPGDGHRTAVAADRPETIKKAIFKVRI